MKELSIKKQTPLTWIIILISAFVFLIAQITDPENVRFLALHYDQVRQSWYTFISYGFVHVEWYHILINMGVLLYIGSWVERLLWQKRYFILVILGILAGGLSLVVRGTGGIGFSAAGADIGNSFRFFDIGPNFWLGAFCRTYSSSCRDVYWRLTATDVSQKA